MKSIIRILLLIAFLFIVSVNGFPLAGAETGVSNMPVLMANLSDSHKVSTVDSTAQGNVMFYLSNDGNRLYYKLNVENMGNVTAAHIRLAEKADSDRVVVRLFDIDSAWSSNISSALIEGLITNDNLVGPLFGQPLSALLREMESGYTYMNIRTKEHPDGLIRGKITSPEN